MGFADYLRLGFAGIKAHKKRTLTVVIIVGLLLSVITAGVLTLQGTENAVLGRMLVPTGSKVLLMSSVDTRVCGEDCDIEAGLAQIKSNIAQYGGKVLDAEFIQTADGIFYALPEGILSDSTGENNSSAMAVAVPLNFATQLARAEMPEIDSDVAEKLHAIDEVREKTLHQVIESKTGEEYYVADILPGEVFASDLSLGNVGQGGNPLDLIFGQLRTSTSQNFLPNHAGGGTKVEEIGLTFAEFPDIATAFNYYQDKANYCVKIDRIFNRCQGKDYKYKVVSAISDPITTYENLQEIWTVVKIATAVLIVIAVIITLGTYTRLLNKDAKIIALYHAMGATDAQIRLVYIVHFLILSALAVLFSIVIGLALAVLLSLANMTAIGQAFSLGFGVGQETIWLIGWNNLILWLVGVMLVAAIITIILGNGNFRAKELARKMK